MRDWAQRALESVKRGQPCALCTVSQVEGSTPREAGARMLISAVDQHGTIGGGRLELDASERARALLDALASAEGEQGEVALTQVYNLGATLGQCCGGKVEVLIQRFGPAALPFLTRLTTLQACGERAIVALRLAPRESGELCSVQRVVVTPGGAASPEGDAFAAHALAEAQRILNDAPRLSAPRWLEPLDGERILLDVEPNPGLPVVLFGAGHVGRALVHVLAPLSWPITWVETRDQAFPDALPPEVHAITTNVPEACVDEAAPGSAFLIMTHDHGLDYALCERVLARRDEALCGLIGSRTKRAKFVHRLSARGVGAAALERLVCPIGLPELKGKAPFEVAISVAAQLLQIHAAQRARLSERPLATVHPVRGSHAASEGAPAARPRRAR